MFEYHGQPHVKASLSEQEWGAKKNAGDCGEFGGLPQVDIMVGGKKVNMGQMGAILRSFGIRFGYYNPRDWKQASLIDPIVDTFADVLAGMGGVLFASGDKAPLIAAL